MNYSHTVIVGRVTKTPELRTTSSSTSVTSFGVAVNRPWTDRKGTKKDDTQFHNVVLFGRTAEVACQYLSKGSTVLVEGRLQNRSWEDKDGQTHRVTEIIGIDIQLGPRLEAKPENEDSDLAVEESFPADMSDVNVTFGDEEDTGRSMGKLL